jgi:Zn finger protein HypA/HybF involved in hydrogenase expression
MTYIEQDIPEEHWKLLTTEEKRRLEKHLCLKCGNPINGQHYYGSLCEECSQDYFQIDIKNEHNIDTDECFLTFVRDRKVKVEFT